MDRHTPREQFIAALERRPPVGQVPHFELVFYVSKHTDGNIMPIVDELPEARPHALHSLDPQAGLDITQVKRLRGHEVCLIGCVDCGLLSTGTERQIVDSASYALKHGMPGSAYIFSTSNCIHPGLPLARYELMLDVWRAKGSYPAGPDEGVTQSPPG